MITEDFTLDTRGQLCPMPIVLASKAIGEISQGQVLKILATDRGSLVDVPAWAHDTGNEVIESGEDGDALVFFIKKGNGA